MVTPSQLHSARALAELSRETLSRACGIDAETIEAIETGSVVATDEQISTLKRTLEAGGILFLPETGPSGAGVRLKFARQTAKRIDIFENEGGPAREDDVR